MAKIILSKGSKVLLEMALRKSRVAIGRRPHNDIVIDDLAVSAEHAVIVTLDRDSFLEDLNSTNGTQVNGQPVKKHFLQNGDVIELAQYRITYLERGDAQSDDRSDGPMTHGAASHGPARIRILSGAGAGRETTLNKAITTIGKPDVQIAAIVLQQDGYFIAHIEGETRLIINHLPIGAEPYRLMHGDVIDLSGTRMQFLLD